MTLGISFSLEAQTRQNLEGIPSNRKEIQLTICSQNLKNYGKNRFDPKKVDPYNDKDDALLRRFIGTACDVIAVQELLGQDENDAVGNLARLGNFLKYHTGREFKVRVGDVNDKSQRVGFLVATDRAEILDAVTYRKMLLPKLDLSQKPRQFTRSPLELQISVKGKGPAPDKRISLIDFHFKSKSNSKDDPALL